MQAMMFSLCWAGFIASRLHNNIRPMACLAQGFTQLGGGGEGDIVPLPVIS